jgi:hypothetical protein
LGTKAWHPTEEEASRGTPLQIVVLACLNGFRFGDRPVAVPLDLEQPAAAVEGLVDERGEHGTDVGRHRSERGVLKAGRFG